MELTNFNNKVIEYLKQRNTLVSSSELCTIMKTLLPESELPPRGRFIMHMEKLPNIIKDTTFKKDMPYFGFDNTKNLEKEDVKMVNDYIKDFRSYLHFNRLFKTEHTDEVWEKLKKSHELVTQNYNMFVSKFPRLLYRIHNLKLKRLPNKPSDAAPFVPKTVENIFEPRNVSYPIKTPIVDYNQAMNLINNAKQPETFVAAVPPGLFRPPKAAHLTHLSPLTESSLQLPPLPRLSLTDPLGSSPGPAPVSAYRQSAFTQPFKPITSYPTISEIYKSNIFSETSLVQNESLLGLEMPKSENLIYLLEKISSIDTPLVHCYRQQLKNFDISRLENLIREIQMIKNQNGDYRIPSYF
jgi:hypothetical protein